MVFTLPACPPQATFAEVIERISARVLASGSPSPRSQFKSSFMGELESHSLPGTTLRQPRNIAGIDPPQLRIAANRRTIAHRDDWLAILRHLHRSDPHRFDDDFRGLRLKRGSTEQITDTITIAR